MTDNALSRPFTRAELYVTKRKTPRGRPCATRYNFVVLTINQCKARANIYFPNSILRYISDGSRVAFSWFTALATASDGALIFRISASDWEARLTQTPLYIAPFAAFDPPTDYYGYGTPFRVYTLLLYDVPTSSHYLLASTGRSRNIINSYELYRPTATRIDVF